MIGITNMSIMATLWAKKSCFTFGEAIIPVGMFLKNVKPLGYKSARNSVAGAFNADEMNPQV